MSAKITLTDHPEDLQIKNGIVSFRIVTGPASSKVSEGPSLLEGVTYSVQCSERQYNRGCVGVMAGVERRVAEISG